MDDSGGEVQQVKRWVSHDRLLAGPTSHLDDAAKRKGLPSSRSKHYRETVITTRAGRLVSSRTRAVQSFDSHPATEEVGTGSDHHVARMLAEASPDYKTHSAEAEAVLKAPPVQFVEVVATLDDVRHQPRAVRSNSARLLLMSPPPSSAAGQAWHSQMLVEEVVASDSAEATVPFGARWEAMKQAARRFFEATAVLPTSVVPAVSSDAGVGNVETTRVPRRLLHRAQAGDKEESPPLVLWDVSPTGHVGGFGRFDAPPSSDARTARFSTGQGSWTESLGVTHYLECVDGMHKETDGSNQQAARCLIQFVSEAQAHPSVLDEALELLDPSRLDQVQESHTHAAAALLAVASSIGTAACQDALATLLVAQPDATPEVKSYTDAHLFFHTVNAITDLMDPLPVVIDALHTSLVQHEEHADQYHQVLLALGSVGRAIAPARDVHRRRVLSTLTAAFDTALEDNKAVEAQFAAFLAEADAVIDAMPVEEKHMWLAYTNHVDRRDWSEIWENAPADQQALLTSHMRETLARILAGNDNQHDGYGLQADYSTPARRLRANPARNLSNAPSTLGDVSDDGDGPRMLPRDPGHHRALEAIFSVQASRLRYAVQALANLGHASSAARVLELCSHRKLAVRAFAVHALHAFPGAESRRVLVSVFADNAEDVALRASAIDALGKWPQAHLEEHGEVRAVALRHLSDMLDVDWRQCELDCTKACVTRGIAQCRRACGKQCKGLKAVEDAVLALLQVRFPDMVGSFRAGDNIPEHSRRLADDATSTTPVERYHAERGARRLFKLLGVLENIMSNTKFQFRAGFQQDWRLSIGSKSLVGAFAGAGLKNILDINIGLFSGFFEIDFDNWAAAKVHMFGFTIPWLDVKLAFTGGMSYVAKSAGQLLGNAQATLGNIAGAIRQLPGRAIGYIVEFNDRLGEVVERVNHYITSGEEFVAMAAQYEDVGAVMRGLAKEALLVLDAKAREMMSKYDVVSMVKNLANDAYDKSVGLLTGPNSTLTRVLNFVDDLDEFLDEVGAFRDKLQDTFTALTGRVLAFPHQVRTAVATLMVPVDKAIEGLEAFEEARQEMGRQVDRVLNFTEEALQFNVAVSDLVEEHVNNYTALLGPVREQAVEVRTVVETIREFVSAGGLGIDTMRTTLLSYMRSLVPDAKARILAEGQKQAAALQETYGARLEATLAKFNLTQAAEAGQKQADAALSLATQVLGQVEDVGASAAGFLGDKGQGSPIDQALSALTSVVDGAADELLNNLQKSVSNFVGDMGGEAGSDSFGGPLGAAQSIVSGDMTQLIDSLSNDVLPRAMSSIAERLQSGISASQGHSSSEATSVFETIEGAWNTAQGGFSTLLSPPIEEGSDTSVAQQGVSDDGTAPSVWAMATNEAMSLLDGVIDPFLGDISSKVRTALSDVASTLPSATGDFGDHISALIQQVAEEALETAAAELQIAGVDVAEALWADVVKLVGDIGLPDSVSGVLKDLNAVADELARNLGRTAVRDVITLLEAALAAMAAEKGDGGGELPPAEAEANARIQRLYDALVTFRSYVLETGISATWVAGFVTGNAATDLIAAVEDVVELAPELMNADNPVVDKYFAAGMAGVRARMPVQELVLAARRIQVAVVVTQQVAATFQSLLDSGGLLPAAGRESEEARGASSVLSSIDAGLITDITNTVATKLATPLAEAHKAAGESMALLLDASNEAGRLWSMYAEGKTCVDAISITATGAASSTAYYAARDFMLAATNVWRFASHTQLTAQHGRSFIAAAAGVIESAELAAACPALHSSVSSLVWPSLTSVVSLVQRVYAPVARLYLLPATQQLVDAITAPGATPMSVATVAAELVAQQLEVAVGPLAGFAAGWFERKVQAVHASVSGIMQTANATLQAVYNMTQEQLRTAPIHPNITAALQCMVNEGHQGLLGLQLSIGLDDVMSVRSMPDVAELGSSAIRNILAAFDEVSKGLRQCIDEAVLRVPSLPTVPSVDTDEVAETLLASVPQFCANVTVNATVMRPSCVWQPMVGFSGTPVTTTVCTSNGTSVNGTTASNSTTNTTNTPTNHTSCEEVPRMERMCFDRLVWEQQQEVQCNDYLTLAQVLVHSGEEEVAERLTALFELAQSARALAVAKKRVEKLMGLRTTISGFQQAVDVGGQVSVATSDDPPRPIADMLVDEVKTIAQAAMEQVAATLLASLSERSARYLDVLRDAVHNVTQEATAMALNSTVVAQGEAAVKAATDFAEATQELLDELDKYTNDKSSSQPEPEADETNISYGSDPVALLSEAGSAALNTLAQRIGDVRAAAIAYAQEVGEHAVAEATTEAGRMLHLLKSLAAEKVAGLDLSIVWSVVPKLADAYACAQKAWALTKSVIDGGSASPLSPSHSLGERISWLELELLPTIQCAADVAGVSSDDVRVGGRLVVSGLRAFESIQAAVVSNQDAAKSGIGSLVPALEQAVMTVTPVFEATAADIMDGLSTQAFEDVYNVLTNLVTQLPTLLHDSDRRSAVCLCGEQEESHAVMAAARVVSASTAALRPLDAILHGGGGFAAGLTVDRAMDTLLTLGEATTALQDLVDFARSDGPLAVVSPRDHTRVVVISDTAESALTTITTALSTIPVISITNSTFAAAARQLRTASSVAGAVKKAIAAVETVVGTFSGGGDVLQGIVDAVGQVRDFVTAMDESVSSPFDVYHLHSAAVRGASTLRASSPVDAEALGALDALSVAVSRVQRDFPVASPNGIALSVVAPEIRSLLASAAANASSLHTLRALNDAGEPGLAVSLASSAAAVRAATLAQGFLGVMRGAEAASSIVDVVLATVDEVKTVVLDVVAAAETLVSSPSVDSAQAALEAVVTAVNDVMVSIERLANQSSTLVQDSIAAAGYGNVGGAVCDAQRASGQCEASLQFDAITLHLPRLSVTLPSCEDFLSSVAGEDKASSLPPLCCASLGLVGEDIGHCNLLPDCVSLVADSVSAGSLPVEECCPMLPELGLTHVDCDGFTSCLDLYEQGQVPRERCCPQLLASGIVHPNCTTIVTPPSPCELLHAQGLAPPHCCDALAELGLEHSDCEESVDCAALAADVDAELPLLCCAELRASGDTHPSCPVLSCAEALALNTTNLPRPCCFDPSVRHESARHPTCQALFNTTVLGGSCSASCVRCVLARLTFDEMGEFAVDTVNALASGVSSLARRRRLAALPLESRRAELMAAVDRFHSAGRRVLTDGLSAVEELTATAVNAVGALKRHGGAIVHHACVLESGYGTWVAALSLLTSSQLDDVAAMAEQQFTLAEVFDALWEGLAGDGDAAKHALSRLGVTLAFEVASAVVSEGKVPEELTDLLSPAEVVGCSCSCACCPASTGANASSSSVNSTCVARQQYARLEESLTAVAQAATSKIGRLIAAGSQTAYRTAGQVAAVMDGLKLLFDAAASASDDVAGLVVAVGTASKQVGASLRTIVTGVDIDALMMAATTSSGSSGSTQSSGSTMLNVDGGIDADAGSSPTAYDVVAVVGRALQAQEDFRKVAKTLGGVSGLASKFQELYRLVLPLVQQTVAAVQSSNPTVSFSLEEPVAGVTLPDLSADRISRIATLVNSILDDIAKVNPAVRDHVSIPTIMSIGFEAHEAWLKAFKKMLQLARVVEIADTASRLAGLFTQIMNIGSLVGGQASSEGPPSPDNLTSWFSFIKDELLPAVVDAVTEMSHIVSASPFKLTGPNQDWVSGSALEVYNTLVVYHDTAMECVANCASQEQRDAVAALAAKVQGVLNALGSIREEVSGQIVAALDSTGASPTSTETVGRFSSAASSSFGSGTAQNALAEAAHVVLSDDLVARFQQLHSAASALNDLWENPSGALDKALEDAGVQSQVEQGLADLQDALAGAMAFQSGISAAFAAFQRIERPLEFAGVVIDLLGSSFTPVPSACPSVIKFGDEVADVVVSRASGMLHDLESLPNAASVVALRTLLSDHPRSIGTAVPSSELRVTLSRIGDALSLASGRVSTIATLNELRMLVFQALMAQLCVTGQQIADTVDATLGVASAAASVASKAIALDFEGASSAASNELVPAVQDVRKTVLGPVLDAWVEQGRLVLADTVSQASVLFKELSDTPLVDVALCSAQGVELAKCPGVSSFASSAAAAMLRRSVEELEKVISPELLASLPVSGDASAATGWDLVNAAGGIGSVSQESLLHLGSMLSVTRYSIDKLRESSNATNPQDPSQQLAGLRQLQLNLQSLGASSTSGAIQPVMWAMESIRGFFGHAAALKVAFDDLLGVLIGGGLLDMDPATLEQLLDSVIVVVEQVGVSAEAGSIPSHLVVGALRLEIALVLDAHAAAVSSGLPDVITAVAREELLELDTLLSNTTSPGAVEALAPSERTSLDESLSRTLSELTSTPPVLGAAVAALKSSFALTRLLPYLTEVTSALEAVRDSQAMEVAKLLFDVKTVIEDGGSVGDAATLMLERLIEQALPIVERLVMPASSVVAQFVADAQAALDALTFTPPTIPTLELGDFSGQVPWVKLRFDRLTAALEAVQTRAPELATMLLAEASALELVGADGALLRIPSSDEAVALLHSARDKALEFVLLLKEVVAAAQSAEVESGSELPSSVSDFVELASDTFKIRCAISCDFDITLAKTLRAVDSAGTVWQSLQDLGRSSSISDLLTNGIEVLSTAVEELRSAAVDPLADEAPVTPAPTSSQGTGLFATASDAFLGALTSGEIAIPGASNEDRRHLISTLEAVVASLRDANLFNTFSGLRDLSGKVGDARKAIEVVVEAGFSFEAERAQALADNKPVLATALYVLEGFTPVIESWLGTRLGDQGIGIAGASVAALQVLAQLVSTVDDLSGLTLTEFGERGTVLSEELSTSLLVWLGDLTKDELGDLYPARVLDAIKNFSLVVEEAGGAVESSDEVQASVAKAFELGDALEDRLHTLAAGVSLPLLTVDGYNLDTAVEYNSVLVALSDWRAALVAVTNMQPEASSQSQVNGTSADGSAVLSNPIQDTAKRALESLGLVSDERYDEGPRLVATASVELVTLMGYIVEVAELLENGADFTTLRRLASKATEELSKRLQAAILKQASGIVNTFSGFVGDTSSQYGNETGSTDPNASAGAMDRVTSFLSNARGFVTGNLATLQTAIDQADQAVDKVQAFRDGIVGEVETQLQVFDEQMQVLNDLFDTLDGVLNTAIEFTSTTEILEAKANQVLTIVITELNSQLNVVISTFDVLVIEINNVENLVLTAVDAAKISAIDTVKRAEDMLFSLGNGFLKKVASKLAEVDTFLKQQQQTLAAWEDVANLALEITLILRDLDSEDDLKLGELAWAMTTIVQGIDFVQAKVKQLQDLRDSLDIMFTKVTDIRGIVTPFIEAVPVEGPVKAVFDGVRTRVLTVKAEAIRMKDELLNSLTELAEQAITIVLERVEETMAPISGALEFVKGVLASAKESANSVFNLVDRREFLFEQMESVLSLLDPPIAAVQTARSFVKRFLGGLQDGVGSVLSALPARRLLDLPAGCSLDMNGFPAMDAAKEAANAATTLVQMLPSLAKMGDVAIELVALVDIGNAQRCVEGSMCGLSTIEARLSDVVDMLDVFETGLVSLEAFGKGLPNVVLAVEGVADCLNPVPAALDAVHAFADDFMSGRLFGVDIEGGMNTVLAHAKSLKSEASKLTMAVEEVLQVFRDNVLSISAVVNNGFDKVGSVLGVLQGGVQWAKKTAESLSDVSAVKDKMEEYIDMLDLAGLMQTQYDSLMDLARDFISQLVIRDGGAFDKIKNVANTLLENMRDGRNLVEDKRGTLMSFAEALNVKLGLGALSSELTPAPEIDYCGDTDNSVCVRQLERSSYRYRNLEFPSLYTRFWYETIPPINDKSRMNRAVVPGLFEAYIPGGVAALDDTSYLITMEPVNANAGKPSLIVRMEKVKNGPVLRIFELFEADGTTPFTGTVRDVTVSGRTTVIPNLPYFVWTCDDRQDAYVFPPNLGVLLL